VSILLNIMGRLPIIGKLYENKTVSVLPKRGYPVKYPKNMLLKSSSLFNFFDSIIDIVVYILLRPYGYTG